jgi:hypothetical protein
MLIYVKWDKNGFKVQGEATPEERTAFGKWLRTIVVVLVSWLVMALLGPHAEPVLRALFGS